MCLVSVYPKNRTINSIPRSWGLKFVYSEKATSGWHNRAVARSEILGGLVVMGGDNVSPLVEIGLADLPNIGGHWGG